ncbi:hypothetical protein [Actinoplanes sp. ATCC 53533]|uniref:hypothetical protein n=1 Tax=Actinoplanes sp. ATCC 53533 TaxID=1288362 RepID=UPI000F798918|nr:hypothetical protein [Actinoplanes sp. ATCC 53533]
MISLVILLKSNYKEIAAVREALVGERIESVTYRQTEHGGLLGIPSEACHEVDLDVVLGIPDGVMSFTWERDDLIEGISISRAMGVPSVEGVINVDAGQSPQGNMLLGQRISSVNFGWQVSEVDCPESLWSIRLVLASGASVVLALGELGGDSLPTYFPDSLLVIFDEQTARSYTHPGVDGSAWASGA